MVHLGKRAVWTDRDVEIVRVLGLLGAAPVVSIQRHFFGSAGRARNRLADLRRCGLVESVRVGLGDRQGVFIRLGPEGLRLAVERRFRSDRGAALRALLQPRRTAAVAEAYLAALRVDPAAGVAPSSDDGQTPPAAWALIVAAGREVALGLPEEGQGVQPLERDVAALAEWAADDTRRRAVVVVPSAPLRRKAGERLRPLARGEGWRRIRIVPSAARGVEWALDAGAPLEVGR